MSVFYSYAHEDEQLRNQLNTHLATLERLHLIVGWHDRDIRAGTEWEHEINRHLNTSQVILLLISAHFIASDYRYSIEMKRALERHEAGEAHVIPILLRPCDVSGTPFSFLQMLPTNGEAITSWSDLDAAFLDVEQGIRRVVQDFLTKTVEQWWRDGYGYHKQKEYRKALTAFNRALRVNPTYVRAQRHKGDVFFELNQNKDALEAYDEALRLDASAVRIHRNRGMVLWRLGKYDEALVAYEEALRHDKSASLFNERGNVLYSLARYEEALTAYTHATKLDPLSFHAFNNKGNALLRLKRYKEALTAYEKAIELDQTFAIAHNNKGRTLYYLKHYREALLAYDRAITLDPHLVTAYQNKGDLLEQLGRTQEAELIRERGRQIK